MKKLFLLAWPIALAAVSCSNEEVVSVNNDANEIKFTAVANNATRALTDSMYCNNWKPGSFDVWALAKAKDAAADAVVGKTYFAAVRYSANFDANKNQLKTLWSADQANIRFWPNKDAEKLDFYAMHNYKGDGTGANVIWDATGTKTARLAVEGYELTTDVANQKDFIYAVKQNQVKNGNNGTIGINFRHALSQVVFKARNTNNTLHVEIGEVKVKNFFSKGNFALPVANTEDNVGEHADPVKTDPAAGTVGTWTGQNTVATTSVDVYKTDDAATTNYAVVKYDTEGTNATNLTNGKDNSASDRDFTKAMLFIPQERTAEAVTPGNVGSKKVETDGEHPYFVVKCKIWNKAGNDFNSETDVCIYDGYAYIPVTVDWKPGKKYIYTFVFGGKNGGYDPDGNDILVPISFTVTVDDFTPIVSEDVNMFQ